MVMRAAMRTRLTWNGSNEAERQHAEALEQLRQRASERLEHAAKQYKAKKPKRRVSYREYLASAKWARKRRKAIEAAGGKCVVCGSVRDLHVHHKHYRTLGREALTDLEVLCADCHRNHHEQDGTTQDSLTEEYLRLSRSF